MRSDESKASDRDLVLRARDGDRQAVAELFTRFWRAARASAYRVVGNVCGAEDAAAEAFREALSALHTLREPDRFAPWLRRIVLRVARRQTRTAGRMTDAIEEGLQSERPDPAKSLETRELALLVTQAVERLPGAEREAILLFYFEGYSGDDAARFLGVRAGTLRRRLHDGRLRLQKQLTVALEGHAFETPKAARLHASVDVLLSADSTPAEWYRVVRDVVFTRPVPYQLLAALTAGWPDAAERVDLAAIASGMLVRPQGPLFEDPGPTGEVARAVRATLSDFHQWALDSAKVLQTFPDMFRRDERGLVVGLDPEMMPPGFASGEPGRYLRATRGLLFGDDGGAVVDPAGLLARSGSLTTFAKGMRPAWLSDVIDVYWLDTRSIELSEVEGWIMSLANQIAPGAHGHCSAHSAPRYKMALRLTLADDTRPAAIGGVLAGWPGKPEGIGAVHLRLYLEPWAQIRSGRSVTAQQISEARGGADRTTL